MQKLRILPLAVTAGLLLPAMPAFAAPAYTSEGSISYFGSAAGSPLAILPLTTGPVQATPLAPSQPAATASASSGQVFSSGSTSYFVSGLGQWVVQPLASAASLGGTAATGTSPSSGGGSGAAGTAAGASTSAGSGAGSTAPANNGSLSAQFLSLVNQARQQAGLGTLADSPVLDRLALAKAQDMVDYGYVAHYSPRLGWPINQEQAAGFAAQSMGAENIAEAGSIQRAMIDLMSDAGHKANLLDPAFTQTGIAVLPVTGGVLVEELFAGPSL